MGVQQIVEKRRVCGVRRNYSYNTTRQQQLSPQQSEPHRNALHFLLPSFCFSFQSSISPFALTLNGLSNYLLQGSFAVLVSLLGLLFCVSSLHPPALPPIQKQTNKTNKNINKQTCTSNTEFPKLEHRQEQIIGQSDVNRRGERSPSYLASTLRR